MTAVTETSRVESVQGNKRVVFATLSINNAYTWDTKLGVLDFYSFTPTSASAVACTVSGGTVTFVTGGALTVRARVEGS